MTSAATTITTSAAIADPVEDLRREPDGIRLRILIGADTYPPDVNGASHFARQLAAGLADRGHDVHVACPAHSAGLPAISADHLGVRVHRLPSMPALAHPTFRLSPPPLTALPLRRLLDELQPDIVHIHSHFLLGRSLSALAARRGIPLVATNHFMPENLLGYLHLPAGLRRGLTRAAWVDFVRIFDRAEHVTTPTPTAARLIVDQGLRTPITAISCGIDLDRFTVTDEGRRVPGLFGLPDLPTIAFVGRLDEEKHLGELIDALPRVRARLDAQLVIAGVGNNRDGLGRRAAALGVTHRVHFLGYVPEHVLPRVYAAADVFAMPGRAELQSLVTLEALASGKPVVAANAMALPHLVRPGRNGLLYPPGAVDVLATALLTVLENPTLRARFARAARLTAEEHSHAQSMSRYEHLYHRLTAVTPAAATAR